MQDFSPIHDADTMQTPAMPTQPRCQCNHMCKFAWSPFVMLLLVELLYLMVTTTLLFFELLK